MEKIMILMELNNKSKRYATHHIDTTRGSRICLPTSRFELETSEQMKALASNELQPEM